VKQVTSQIEGSADLADEQIVSSNKKGFLRNLLIQDKDGGL